MLRGRRSKAACSAQRGTFVAPQQGSINVPSAIGVVDSSKQMCCDYAKQRGAVLGDNETSAVLDERS